MYICFCTRDFWVSWESSSVKVGQGSTWGDNVLAEYNAGEDFHDVNAVHFATYDTSGKFEFLRSYG